MVVYWLNDSLNFMVWKIEPEGGIVALCRGGSKRQNHSAFWRSLRRYWIIKILIQKKTYILFDSFCIIDSTNRRKNVLFFFFLFLNQIEVSDVTDHTEIGSIGAVEKTERIFLAPFSLTWSIAPNDPISVRCFPTIMRSVPTD